jgi:hypothetical protein
VIDHQD